MIFLVVVVPAPIASNPVGVSSAGFKTNVGLLVLGADKLFNVVICVKISIDNIARFKISVGRIDCIELGESGVQDFRMGHFGFLDHGVVAMIREYENPLINATSF
jgi:hypothetical protein